jgi:hypothetical protein
LRIPFVKLSKDFKVLRVHYNYTTTGPSNYEPGLGIAFFINLENSEVTYFDFRGSINLLNDLGDPLLKYHYFFLTDLDCFSSDFCLVRRKLRKNRQGKSVYSFLDSYEDNKSVEVLKLNLKSMKLDSNPVCHINQNEAFITL